VLAGKLPKEKEYFLVPDGWCSRLKQQFNCVKCKYFGFTRKNSGRRWNDTNAETHRAEVK
jgi:hypothetical protein